MKQLSLGKHGFTTVDDDVYEWASLSSWSFTGGAAARATQYAGRRLRNGGTDYLHRIIMGAVPGEQVDHVDGDKLNNQRANLRIVTNGQNAQNRHAARKDSSTGARGVYLHKGRYRIQIFVNKIKYSPKESYATIPEAAAVAAELRRSLMAFCDEPADKVQGRQDRLAFNIASDAVREWELRVARLELQLGDAHTNLEYWVARRDAIDAAVIS